MVNLLSDAFRGKKTAKVIPMNQKPVQEAIQIDRCQTIVFKIGSSLLTRQGRLDPEQLKRFVQVLSRLHKQNINIILVSSGAVASAGFVFNDKKLDKKTLPSRQALSSIGQVELMERYKKHFKRQQINIAQILMSQITLKDRESFLNARHTLKVLLQHRVIPIINENDALSTDELRLGDNDVLGAVISGLCDAELYVILSDVDGLYRDFGTSRQKQIPIVEKINDDISALAKGPGSNVGTGGMNTKIEAARTAASFGIPTWILSGKNHQLYKDLIQSKGGTYFQAKKSRFNKRKQWIASGINLKASLIVDEGAAKAISQKNKSLLARGITHCSGQFYPGDLCEILDDKEKVIAKGRINYSHDDLIKIIGKNKSEIEAILGSRPYDEVVHKDNLVVL